MRGVGEGGDRSNVKEKGGKKGKRKERKRRKGRKSVTVWHWESAHTHSGKPDNSLGYCLPEYTTSTLMTQGAPIPLRY
jgi:hypothetical protein